MPNNAGPIFGTSKRFLTLTEPLHAHLFLEIIALLTHDDINNARLVSKKWQSTIGEPDTLSHQMFLVPDEKPQGRPIYPWVSGHNIIFTGHFQPPTGEDAIVIDEEYYPECYTARPVVSVHPKLTATDDGDGGPVTAIKVSFPSTLKDMLSWKDGEWQEELLTQPPQKEVRIQVEDGDPQDLIFGGVLKRPNHKYLDVADEEGVQFGKLVDLLRAMVYPHHSKKGRKKKCPRSKVVRTRFSLETYQTLSFCVEHAVLLAGYWDSQALEFED